MIGFTFCRGCLGPRNNRLDGDDTDYNPELGSGLGSGSDLDRADLHDTLTAVCLRSGTDPLNFGDDTDPDYDYLFRRMFLVFDWLSKVIYILAFITVWNDQTVRYYKWRSSIVNLDKWKQYILHWELSQMNVLYEWELFTIMSRWNVIAFNSEIVSRLSQHDGKIGERGSISQH